MSTPFTRKKIFVGNVRALSHCFKECPGIVSLLYGMSVHGLIVVGNVRALSHCFMECPCIFSLS